MNRILAAATTAILVTACSAAPEQAWEEKSQSKGACNVEIRSQLRDPSSFQAIRHISQDGSILVEFRAKNGFGGFGVGTAICTPAPGGAKAVIVSS
jgi:hypothetical protein